MKPLFFSVNPNLKVWVNFCERREYIFNVLPEYLRIFPKSLNETNRISYFSRSRRPASPLSFSLLCQYLMQQTVHFQIGSICSSSPVSDSLSLCFNFFLFVWVYKRMSYFHSLIAGNFFYQFIISQRQWWAWEDSNP